MLLVAHLYRQCALCDVDELGAGMMVRALLAGLDWKELRKPGAEPPFGCRIVEGLEPIRYLRRAFAIRKGDALVLPDDGDEWLVAGACEKELEPDAEHERDTQQ